MIYSEATDFGNELNKKSHKMLLISILWDSNVNLLGFEPRLAESKSDVLPLHHKSI
jgi:hypothetical protein